MTGKRKVSYSSYEDHSTDEDFIPEEFSQPPRSGDTSIASTNSQEPRKKRGRGPSKRPCTNRNALMARVNRQRKKEYLESIETKLTYYRKANKNLANVVQQQGIDLKRLSAEVSYLRSIINNNTSITTLLRTMNESLRRSKCRTEEDNWDSELFPGSQAALGGTPKTSPEPSAPGNDNEFYQKPSKTLLSSVESDHSYSNGIVTNDIFNFEGINCDPSFRGGVDLVGNPNVINSNEDSQLGITDVDIGQLGDFDTDIFDLPNDGSDGIDLFRSEQPQPENLFDNLDGSGICLHVNSGKISLEYCSICHLNSINSDDP
ncbi:uncharacterized protein LOC107040078 isoform X1 [Diachasma alloeum]|uniref:uncharacterized protein LOC107040078 isoform X1 n=1 Tax=Diachasma alloeum TaxID=454923 RepID=UPI0007384150|nr:uncharacterized protein LOC107040078 isoform X1 [Diachasma alloeum]